ncbi:MAG: protein-L-isoaspartate(D-aspartate) O-methyltransferase [Candidatus Aminicenantales bacterium]
MRKKQKHYFKSVTACLILLFSFPPLMNGEDVYVKRRREMVLRQLQARDITDKRVLEVMGRVPRHLFVGPSVRSRAYEDYPLPIDEGQTISQPYIVALMTQCLDLKGDERVLEIGTGSGYQAAVLAELVKEVFSIEIREPLARKASRTLQSLNTNNVRVKWADGYFGWEEHAPFDAIIVTCAANHIPPPLLKQLKEGGKLIIPVGSTLYFQTLTLITKIQGQPRVKYVSSVSFVPMTGEIQKRKGE